MNEKNETALKENPKDLKNTGFKKNHLWWQLLALVVISLFSVYASGAFDKEFSRFMPEKQILISTKNTKQSGLSGLFELLTRLDFKPKLWKLSYRELKEFKGALVMVAPNYSLQDYDVKRVLKWVKEGNTLVYIDDFKIMNSRIITKRLKVKVRTAVKELKKKTVETNSNLDWLEGVDSINVSTTSRLLGGTNIAGDRSGSVLLMVEHGKGKVILGNCPRMLSNDLIADRNTWNNFQLFVNWANSTNQQIYFDERIHGLTGGRNVFLFLSRGPFGYVGVQLLLIIFIALVSSIQRFGKAKSLSDSRRISNLEFIDGLSNAYKRAKANASVLEILFHSFRVEVSKMLGISAHENDQVLINAWKNNPIIEDLDLESVIAEYNQVISNRRISDADLQKLVATCDKITDSQTKGDLEVGNYAKSS